MYGYGFGVTVLLAFNLQIYYVAGYYVGYKHHHFIHARQGHTFSGYIRYRYLFEQRKLFLFSGHS